MPDTSAADTGHAMGCCAILWCIFLLHKDDDTMLRTCSMSSRRTGCCQISLPVLTAETWLPVCLKPLFGVARFSLPEMSFLLLTL